MPEVRTRIIEEHRIAGLPLGRHVHHDDASRPFVAEQAAFLKSADHPRLVPAYDQGDLGSCTGNALVGALMTVPLTKTDRVLDEGIARLVYSMATRIDSGSGYWPPTDTGSSGLAVCKAAKNAGLISSYRHTFSLESALAALVLGPVIIGINWYDTFDHPDMHGEIKIGTGAQVRGGHEVELSMIDPDRRMVGGYNSWGSSWGLQGRFTMSFDTLGRLLDEDGDVTVPVL